MPDCVTVHWYLLQDTGIGPMWRAQTEEIEAGRVLQLRFYQGDDCLSYRQTLVAWREQQEFREVFMQQLRNAPFAALRW